MFDEEYTFVLLRPLLIRLLCTQVTHKMVNQQNQKHYLNLSPHEHHPFAVEHRRFADEHR